MVDGSERRAFLRVENIAIISGDSSVSRAQ